MGAGFALLFLTQLLPSSYLDTHVGPGAFSLIQTATWLVAFAGLAITAWRERHRLAC